MTENQEIANRILIAEDDPVSRRLLEAFLQKSGYHVVTAVDGLDALRILESEDAPALAVLDWMMPGLEGPQVCQRVRARPDRPYTYILLLTGRSQKDDLLRGLEAGADDYLTKPFAFVELLARVRALLRRGQPALEKLQVADLLVDTLRRKVTRNAETIELAPKEYGILEYMMRNKGRPLSRTMIVEHVWDMDYDGLTNIVDVYIRHLRSKIDDRFSQKLIQTVRGIGYLIDAPEPPADKPVTAVFERPA